MTAQDMFCLNHCVNLDVLPGLQDKDTASRTGSDDKQPVEVLASFMHFCYVLRVKSMVHACLWRMRTSILHLHAG